MSDTKTCPKGKILNKVSKRCVNIDGKVGKSLQKQQQNEAKTRSPSVKTKKNIQNSKPATIENTKPKAASKKINQVPENTKPKAASKKINQVPENTKKKNKWLDVIRSLYPCIVQVKGAWIHVEVSRDHEEHMIKYQDGKYTVITFVDAHVTSKMTSSSNTKVDKLLEGSKKCVGVYLSCDKLNTDKPFMLLYSRH
jgi:hypothetical protein